MHPRKAEMSIDGSSFRDEKCLDINLGEITHCLTILLKMIGILNIGFSIPRMLYVNLAVAINEKPIIDTHTKTAQGIQCNEFQHTITAMKPSPQSR